MPSTDKHSTSDCWKKTTNEEGERDFRVARMLTRCGIILVLAIATYATLSFCFNVYFDRFVVFNNALSCTINILNNSQAEFWLRNGTLLGATRMGKLIMWDSDLSFGIRQQPNNTQLFKELHKTCFSRSLYTDGNALSRWHMCNTNICAVFDEAKFVMGAVETTSGTSPVEELLPLQECNLMDVKAFCPHNPAFYLQSAFGRNWLTTPFMELFNGNAQE